MAAPTGEKDVAIDMVGEQGHQIDPAVAARAVRKMDWFFIPAMTVGVSPRRGPNNTRPASPIAPRLTVSELENTVRVGLL